MDLNEYITGGRAKGDSMLVREAQWILRCIQNGPKMSLDRRGLPGPVSLALLVQLPVEGDHLVKSLRFGLAVLGTLPLQCCQPLLFCSAVAFLCLAEPHTRRGNLSFIALPAKAQNSSQTTGLRWCELLPTGGRFPTRPRTLV
ncbi:hypothetical protein SPRI_4065 [Streptomyces pristinaespiralis]|uniref:Uncharacterized protein n=1 Tax=Streptomyces pristinaespiralis TaxID=38300 RepID=A0A0M4DBX5_STRPR|nr:hypothetical protein SPRI_4065 [Streptomyces pristinaespiralis]